MKDEIAQTARELGFHLFGVAAAEPLHEDAERLREALAERRLEPLEAWIGVDPGARADPRRLLAGAQSVIMVGLSYAQTPPAWVLYSAHPEGRVARYALAEDYHRVIGEKLEGLADALKARAAPRPVRTRVCVDTAPLLERAFAQRAGLGFIGRNNCLIHPIHGSWFLLGALITDVELEADAPLDGDCGSCTLCMDACPAGALVGPHRLDARRCVSCLTVETRAWLEAEACAAVGPRLFGCDVCQEVCPYNHAPLPCEEARLTPEADRADHRLDGGFLRLADILVIPSNSAFAQQLGHSPLLRPRRRGMLRNALIVAANLRRKDLIRRILEIAGNPQEHGDVRRQARQTADLLEER